MFRFLLVTVPQSRSGPTTRAECAPRGSSEGGSPDCTSSYVTHTFVTNVLDLHIFLFHSPLYISLPLYASNANTKRQNLTDQRATTSPPSAPPTPTTIKNHTPRSTTRKTSRPNARSRPTCAPRRRDPAPIRTVVPISSAPQSTTPPPLDPSQATGRLRTRSASGLLLSGSASPTSRLQGPDISAG